MNYEEASKPFGWIEDFCPEVCSRDYCPSWHSCPHGLNEDGPEIDAELIENNYCDICLSRLNPDGSICDNIGEPSVYCGDLN